MRETRHGSGNRRLSFFDAATATDIIHWLAIIAIAVAVLTCAPAQADQWSLLINGKAIHLEELRAGELTRLPHSLYSSTDFQVPVVSLR
jgi:hypothetical protein